MGYSCSCGLLLLLSTAALLVCGESQSRTKREAHGLDPGNWDSCKPGAEAPPTRVPTQDLVQYLRMYFASKYIEAYLIPNEDAHQSEYPSDYDKRRGFISGFKGSAGIAVITTTKAALWTDGRYFLEAEDTLDCGWILMRQGETGVPTVSEWLKKELRPGVRVGASPYLISSSGWKTYVEDFQEAGIYMQEVQDELIDKIWNVQLRPPRPNSDINALPLEFAGKTWQDKVADIREEMAQKDADMMVVTGLDETAWLFNLRASDISYNPFFISYAIVENDTIRLYLLDHLNKTKKAPSDPATSVTLAEHLNTDPDTGSCSGREGMCVEVKLYSPETVTADVETSAAAATKVWISYACNYAIYSKIPRNKIHQANTPIATMKTKKNPTEVEGMKNSHVRDAVALISFMAKLETEVKDGQMWTEMSASDELEKFRSEQINSRGSSFPSISSAGANGAIIHYRPTPLTNTQITEDTVYLLDSGGQYLEQENNRGLSFDSISGSGPNGAIIHYVVLNETNREINTQEMYLLDSGGQYLDGTTDVTRTFHFGTPTKYQKECYTRVLMGHIDLFQTQWPKGLYGRQIDAIARRALWDVGLVYRHGTGHGIGMYLSVHEGPGRISLSVTPLDYDNVLDENQFYSDGPAYISKSTYSAKDSLQILDEFQFLSNEPGYYEDGEFGIRLENIVMVKNATTKYDFPNTQFLTFEHITLVPYEPKLIQYDLLSDRQIDYLNDYHQLCREKVGPELNKQGQTDGFNWLKEKSEKYTRPRAGGSTGGAAYISQSYVIMTIAILLVTSLSN